MSPDPRNPYAPPTTADPRPWLADEPASPSFPRAWTIAGVLFLARAALIAGDALLADGAPQVFITAFWDVIVGAGLLSGNPRFRRWGILRLAIGIVIGALQIPSSDARVLVFLQVLSWGGILSLLLGRAGKGRIALGLAAFAPFALLEGIGFALVLARH